MSFQKFKTVFEKRTAETIVLIGLIALAAVATQASGGILNSGSSSELVAEYRFDTGAGETAYDTSGNNDGKINGASWTSGVEGKALKFDGSNDYVDSPVSFDQDDSSDSYTVTAWFKSDEICQTDQGIVGQDNGGYDFFIEVSRDNCGEMMVATGSDTQIISSGTLTSNKWYFISVKLEKDKIYYSLNGENWKDTGASRSNYDSSHESRMAIGSISYDNSGETFDGSIDSVRFHQRGLNSSQIRSIYNSGSWRIGTEEEGDPSKVLDMSFQHQNSSYVLDTSGYNNHGERLNGVGQENSIGCKVGRCYSFDGNEDAVNLEDTVVLEREGSTVSWWMKPSQTSSTGLFNSGVGGYDNYISVRSDTLTAETRINCNGFYFDQFTKSGNWNHYSIVLENSKAYLYENGKYLGEATSYRKESCDGNEATQLLDNIDVNYIGAETNYNPYYSGKIDQVKIFNRSLSQQEIIENTEGLDLNGAVLDMRFNSGGGDHVEDYSNENNHGNLMWNESWGPTWTEGLNSGGLEFDGYNDRVEPELTSTSDKPEKLTVSAWYKTEGGYNTKELVSDEIYSPDEGFGLESDSFAVGRGNGNGMVSASGTHINGEWTHVVGTYDNSKVKFYQNGELVDQTSFNGPYSKSNRQLAIGYDPWRNVGFDSGFGWKGKLDEVKIYSYAASASHVKNLYREGKQNIEASGKNDPAKGLRKDLVLSQTFDRVETCGQSDTVSCPSGMSGEVAVDESGEANHGELVNDPTVKGAGDCKVGRCLEFDGNDDYVKIDSSGVSGEEMTIAAWVNINGPGDSSWNRIVDIQDGSNNEAHGFVWDEDDDRYGFFTPGGNAYVDQDIPLGEWVFLTGVLDSSEEKIKFYTDGELRTSISGNTSFSDLKASIGKRFDKNDHTNGLVDQVRVYNRSLSGEKIWKLYTQGRDRDPEGGKAGPVAHYPVNKESSPLSDVSGEGNNGDLNLLGESGTFKTSDGEWKTVRFERSYEDPVVVGTTNTKQGESGLSFEARDVDSNSAKMRVCESEGENAEGCDTHGTEKVGYLVINAKATEDIPGIESGTFEIDSEIDSKLETISYSESFSNAPYVMANINSDNGKNPVEARITDYSASDFTAGICYQNTNEGCDVDHPHEKVGWVALEPGNLPFEQVSEVGSTGNSVSGSSWTLQSFSNTYSGRPVVIASTLSDDGGHELEIDEVRNVNSTHAEVRYCEQEGSDGCEGHTSEEVSWFAAKEGLLTYSNGNFPRYRDTERGKALEFDGNDDRVEIKDTVEYSEDSVTVGAWLKQTGTASSYYQRVTDGGLTYWVDDRDGDTCVRLTADEGGGSAQTCFNTGLDKNEWHHLLFTYDSSTSETKLYVDGELFGTSSYYSGDMTGYTNSLTIGNNAGGSRPWKGQIDDVRIYPYALNEDQVKQVAKSGAVSVG